MHAFEGHSLIVRAFNHRLLLRLLKNVNFSFAVHAGGKEGQVLAPRLTPRLQRPA